MSSVPSATQWGLPASSNRRALLIHGLTSSSHTWERVAQALVEAGYFVVAPNLLSHGFRHGTDFSVGNLAKDIQPYFVDTHYDIIIGHSLGGAILAELLPFLAHRRPISAMLVDPALEVTPDIVDVLKIKISDCIANVRPIEAYMAENPNFTRVDAVTRIVGLHMYMSVEAMVQTFAVSTWRFSRAWTSRVTVDWTAKQPLVVWKAPLQGST
ncbi:hypothetical protein SCLCIDRAFT_1213905 [Scleroderma citrinum Foug A]|uniref:AB hydrolase-1 domain-containing protein n=1 Tax=Scleroderma citrinum Foug A TaxID=1036808 RepID=A0A0C3E5M7_9AGAM|nr:hypothetical protein SCLCIDRAFT_1213905 [Scleroderma citrinum Foug A]